MVQADLVEGVFERNHALDFVRLDDGGEHRAHGERRLAGGHGVAAEPVGRGQNAAQVVAGMAPLRRQPGVIEVQPANQRADVEGRLHRVKLKLGARNLGAVGNHRALDDGAEQLAGSRVFERFQAAAQGVDQDVARRVVGKLGLDRVVERVVDDIDDNLVPFGADVADVCRHVCWC